MRPSASSCQSSRYRLLTPLLVLLLGIYCAQTVGGSSPSGSANLGVQQLLTSSHLTGGTPLALNYHLISQCWKHVQIMTTRGPNAINAMGDAASSFAVLTFESHSPTELKILGVKAQKYMCFSKSGKLIGRVDGRSELCLFREQEKGGYIMLQSVAEPQWYVGFNKRGRRKTGYSFSKTKKNASKGNGTSVSVNTPLSKRRGRQRKRHHNLNRPGRKRRPRWRVLERRRLRERKRRMRGSRVRQSRDRTMCFQFTRKRIDQDLSDPRVQNSLLKQIHDPWRDSDVSKFVSTPNPR